MNSQDQVHALVLNERSANTLCGLNVIAIYPMQQYAMTDEAGKANVRYTMDGKPTCKACYERWKEGGK